MSDLRRHAIDTSLLRAGTLRQAVDRLGFIQADPIRSPARAQDLILRQRVKDYRVGDIERQYSALQLEEDRLYAYGYMPQSTWRLLHPRAGRRLTPAEQRVLDIAISHQRLHPRDLEAYLGKKAERNAWGGQSKTTTRILERLHFQGLLRVAGRENGIRVFEPALPAHEPLEREERLHRVVLLVASILGPLSEASLRTTLGYVAYGMAALKGQRPIVSTLIESGELANAMVDGIRYVWPAGRVRRGSPNETVRFLAPFDPLVWDRQRFEHFWGWPYRFEAYVPPPKRQLGYYAMPMLWRDDVIGWVNISNQGGILTIEPGFRKARPTDAAFEAAFGAEVAGFTLFMQKRDQI